MRDAKLIAMTIVAAVATAGCPFILGVEGEFESTTGGAGNGTGTDGSGANGPGSGTGGGATAGGAGGGTTATGSGGAGGGGGAPPLVQETVNVDHIAVNATHVFWIANPEADEAEVRRIPKEGGQPQPMLTAPNLKDLAVTDGAFVAASTSVVYRRPLGNMNYPSEASWSATNVSGVTIDLSRLYYTQDDNIFTVANDQTNNTQFEPGEAELSDIVAGLGFVYWTLGVGAKRVPHSQGNTQTFSSPPGRRLAVEEQDGGYQDACWTTTQAGHVYCWSSEDPVVHDVTTMGALPTSIALFSKYVYWTESSTGRVARAPITGAGPVQELATGQGGPSSIAVDDSGIYWTNRAARQIMHLANP